MLTITRETALYGTVTLSAPRGIDYAWRTLSGARVSGYVRTIGEASRALSRVQAHHGPTRP